MKPTTMNETMTENTRELTADELGEVSGGFLAFAIGFALGYYGTKSVLPPVVPLGPAITQAVTNFYNEVN